MADNEKRRGSASKASEAAQEGSRANAKLDEALRLDNQLCFALYAAGRAMTQAYRPLLDELGVTYPQYLVLLVLWETDGLSVKQLGERLYLDSGTLTPLLKRLESAGYVRRVRSQTDERRIEIGLTPAGRSLKKRARAIPETLACSIRLSASELKRIRGDLRRLFQLLTENKE